MNFTVLQGNGRIRPNAAFAILVACSTIRLLSFRNIWRKAHKWSREKVWWAQTESVFISEKHSWSGPNFSFSDVTQKIRESDSERWGVYLKGSFLISLVSNDLFVIPQVWIFSEHRNLSQKHSKRKLQAAFGMKFNRQSHQILIYHGIWEALIYQRGKRENLSRILNLNGTTTIGVRTNRLYILQMT
jgi:hypothetical protein